ncbi:MAG: amino acid transporter [Anaerolineae bacterium]|nr:amino acid transporter [Anaerolineae bacterium]
MNNEIPYEQWQPLSVVEVITLFAEAPFQWGLAGGYAVEQFLGINFRSHGDMDVTIYRDEQLKAQSWLSGWELYAADPPGTLRKWTANEYLPIGIHDIWGHKIASTAWQFQFMLAEVDGDEWVSRRSSKIRGKRNDLIVKYNDLPCIRIEVQLMYKAKSLRPKDELDFQMCLPKLSHDAKQWLKESLLLLYPEGHRWLSFL